MAQSAAKREYQRRRRAELREIDLPPGDPAHGTPAGYDYYGCRCQVLCAPMNRVRKNAMQIKRRAEKGRPDRPPRRSEGQAALSG